ncbi:MAG: nucleotidyltransferase family protein [Pseudomonadota bacterium]
MHVAAILLAAGFSSRMGAPNKLVMPIGGRPLIARVAQAVVDAVDTRPLVVLGHEAAQVRKALGDMPVDLVTNPSPEHGQSSSVRLGLETVPEAETTLIVLGDLAFLTADALRALLRDHDAAGDGRITVPMNGDVRGNPIALPRAQRQSILASGARIGCGGFTRKHPELTRPFATQDPAFFMDVDTPDALAEARVRLGDTCVT